MLLLIGFLFIIIIIVNFILPKKPKFTILHRKKIENFKILRKCNIMSQNYNAVYSTDDIEEIDDVHLINEDDEDSSLVKKGYFFIQNFKEYGDIHSYEPFIDDLNKLIYRKNQKGYEFLKIYIKCFNKFSSILQEELPNIISGELPIDLTNKKVLGHFGGIYKAIQLVEEGLNYIMEDQHTNFTYNFKLVKNGIDLFFRNAPAIYSMIAKKYYNKNISIWNFKLQKMLIIDNEVNYKKVIDYYKVGNEFFSVMSYVMQ